MDASNNVYVTNKAEDKIQKFDASGAFLLAWGGHGSGNGQLIDPAAIAVAPSGLVYVTDTGNNRIEVFDQSGVYQMQWGSFGTNASLKQMDTPSGIAIDAGGSVYVADLNNHRIEKFGAAGAYVNTWGLYGTGDGQFTNCGGSRWTRAATCGSPTRATTGSRSSPPVARSSRSGAAAARAA